MPDDPQLPQRPPNAPATPSPAEERLRADSELRFLKGVGPRRAEALAEQGFCHVGDLLGYLPIRYEDRRRFARVAELRSGVEAVSLDVRVLTARLIRTRRRGFTIFEATVEDDSGQAKAVFYNQAYLQRVLTEGRRVVLYGRANLDRRKRLVLDNPEVEPLDDDAERVHSGRVVPVYRKLADVTPRHLRGLIHRAFERLDPTTVEDRLPPTVRDAEGLLPRFEALRRVHFPDDEVGELEDLSTLAQRTLAFEEVFLLQLALALRRDGRHQQARGIAYEVTDALRGKLAELLPFKLTAAQKRVLKEIGADLRAPHPMNRLLQGDVGSGKTIVALLALLVAIDNRYQAALMAPTEILAEQHRRSVAKLFADHPELQPPTTLLTGSLKAAQRRRALESIELGEAKLVIGTHALFVAGVRFRRLGMVVVDEQHRFGVAQRAALGRKGVHPDILVMTATPIPRTLSLTLYGDLDVSVIDERPPGRVPVRTVVRHEEDRPKVLDGLRKEVARGRQAYVVTPLAEETEKSDLKDAERHAAQLRKALPDLSIEVVHGKMKPADKEAVMQRFVAGEVQVLVATTVIEVGVDVPNASVMIVEHAERFGLSQLHQLRGRVGRGGGRSYCVLMNGAENATLEATERLKVMEATDDGFRIAEKDLELRGPGSVFGTQQSGLSDLQFLAVTLRSPELIERARARAKLWVGQVGALEAEKLLRALGGRWSERLELARVG